MRKRRQGCVEFESAPATSSASDAKASERSTASVPVESHERDGMAKGPSALNTSSGGHGLSPSALQEVLRKRREACAEFESAPDGSTADVVAQEATSTADFGGSDVSQKSEISSGR